MHDVLPKCLCDSTLGSVQSGAVLEGLGTTVTVQSKRTLKIEKLARIYDDEIAPVWGTRFGKMLLRNLAVPEKRAGARHLVRHRLPDDRDPAPDERGLAADRDRCVERDARRRAPQGRRPRPARQEGRVLPHRERGAEAVVRRRRLRPRRLQPRPRRDAEPRGRAARLRARRQAGRRGALHAAARRHVRGVPRHLPRGADQARQARGARAPRAAHRALPDGRARRALHEGGEPRPAASRSRSSRSCSRARASSSSRR